MRKRKNTKMQEIYDFCKAIFPICRSLTGEGVRETLRAISTNLGGVPLDVKAVPSGTQVFDWTIPKEWRIREAFIEDEAGEKIIDFKKNNLHVMGYSTPVNTWLSLEELKEHIYTQPDQPNVIPYVTSYYKERWGFCMSQEQKDALKRGKYHAVIDSELFDGVLNYGEVFIPSNTNSSSEKDGKDEIFFSTYVCHPSMANNECSGPALAAALIRYVNEMPKRRYGYRFIFIPETIGSITYLSQDGHLEHLKKHMVAGFNLSCVGDDKDYSIVESRYGNTLADRVLRNVLHFHTNDHYSRYSFLQRGSDERQYNAPGIELPVVCYCRSKFGEYPEYHTSADDMNLVSVEGFKGSYEVMTKVIEALEGNKKYRMTVLGEPQLGKRGLYPTVSQKGNYSEITAMMDFITYANGTEDLIGISDRIGVEVGKLTEIAEKLCEHKLMEVENA